MVDASLEMVFGLLASYSARWDAAAWRVLTQRVVRHMLSLPPGLSPPAPQAALDSLSSRPLSKQPANLGEGSAGSSNATATSRLAVASGTGFGSPVGDSGSGGSTAVSSLSGGQVLPAAAFSSVLSQLGGGGVGGGGAGGAVQVGMSVAEQGLLMTTMLKRMDRYYPLLCDQAAHIRAEYRVSCKFDIRCGVWLWRGLICLSFWEGTCTPCKSKPGSHEHLQLISVLADVAVQRAL